MPVSSGRITKVRKGKHGKPSTSHGKNHRWESFSSKLAKLHSLDPLRRVRRHDLDVEADADLLSFNTSYLQQGLQRWGELNLSGGFAAFQRRANPLCESLAQILHFDGLIMSLLDEHISAHDRESMEPLLDLLTAFAHDLGPRFERHYGRSLALLAGILERQHDVGVIEWTFGTLAYLFKYLSKLLVPDLRPTYRAIAPLLGRVKTTPHIARFTAEAMSFLIKKAAAPSHREGSLANIVTCVREDLCALAEAGDRQFSLYRDGIMTMFAEAIKGTGEAIHSSGPVMVKALLAAVPSTERELAGAPGTWTSVVCGTVTSVLHESNAAALGELVQAVVDHVDGDIQEQQQEEDSSAGDGRWRFLPWFQVLGTLAGVRGGRRIANWPPLIKATMRMMEALTRLSSAPAVPREHAGAFWRMVIANLAIIWHRAPMDTLIPFMLGFVQAMTREPFMGWLVPFCSYFDQLDSSRFTSLFRKDFQKFIAGHWSDNRNEEMLCVTLPKISRTGSGDGDKIRLPQDWQDQIVSKFERLEVSPFPERGVYGKDPQTWRGVCLPKYSALLQVLESTAVHPSTNARISELLLRKLKLALRPSSSLASDEVHFIVSQGLTAYLRMATQAGLVDKGLGPLLRAAVPRFARSVNFLQAFLEYEQTLVGQDSSNHTGESNSSRESSVSDEDPVVASLIRNLTSPSHPLRLASLKLLRHLHSGGGHGAVELLDNLVQIEQTPLDIENMRAFGMHFRRVQQAFHAAKPSLRPAIPSFLFGMLTVKLSSVWDDAIETLKQLSSVKECEEVVCEIAFAWLEVPSPRRVQTSQNPDGPDGRRRGPLTAFDCTKLLHVMKIADDMVGVLENQESIMLRWFDEQQRTAEPQAANSRAQALGVFSRIPELAEKRSRRLVPLFLSWASLESEDAEVANEADHGEDIGPAPAADWSLADRKALLGVLGKCTNPRALFRADNVYSCLLDLLKNGDVEIQRLAMRAIFAWRRDGIRPYQESLENLLDDAKFRNELTVLLQSGDDGIKPDHRADLMPVLLRLLFGRSIAKKGSAARHGMLGNRLTIIRNLSMQDLGSFLEIALGRLRDVSVVDASLTTAAKKALFEQPVIPLRNQLGFLNMISIIVKELGTEHAAQFMDTLLNAMLYCLVFSCRHLGAGPVEAENGENEDAAEKISNASLLASTRTAGLKCLITLFELAPENFDWRPYRNLVLEEVVAPRLEKLPVETAQGVSTLLRLFSAWSAHAAGVLFLAGRDVFPQIVECLAVEKGKAEVKVTVLGLVRNLARQATDPETDPGHRELVKSTLLDPSNDTILQHVTSVLRSPGLDTDLLEACIETVIDLAPSLEHSGKTGAVLAIATFLLEQPPRRVSPKAKSRILLIVERFVVLLKKSGAASEKVHGGEKLFSTLSALFGYFKDRQNREVLARVFSVLAEDDPELQEVAPLVIALNSFEAGRLDEPDYNRRLHAYFAVSGARETPLTRRQWLPIVHNLLFFIVVDAEFGVLTQNSADGLRRFIQDATSATGGTPKPEFEGDLETILLPAIYGGAREASDTVRREFLRIFAFLLSQMPSWEPISDIRGLLDHVDEKGENPTEPSFFFHLLSPAVQRQLEALRILEAANGTAEIGSRNLVRFFIPLLEHFVFGRPEETDGGVGAQAVTVIGVLARSLEWKHYRALMHRYIAFIASRPESVKRANRLLGAAADALVDAVKDRHAASAALPPPRQLARTLPPTEKLHADVLEQFLPPLLKHINQKDESEVSHRVPVAVVATKLLKLLPEEQTAMKLAGVLTDVCHILRSKAWESREMARTTLAKMCLALGPSYFGFILRELRGALTKGYQLHVLSYTMHSILVTAIPDFAQGELDYCLPEIVTVIMDDIFGVVGFEKEAKEYKTDIKEIKSSKSHDSMELVARTSSIDQLGALTRPLQGLLMQKVDLKMVRKIDALLARITAGLLQNPAAESRDTLVFCYEVIQEYYKSQGDKVGTRPDPHLRKYLYRRGAAQQPKNTRMRHTHKLARFAFETLRSTLKRHDGLRTAANITGFVPILGDFLVGGEDEVKTAVFRLLTVIARVPCGKNGNDDDDDDRDDTKLYKVATKEAFKGISLAPSTTTDLAQAALKLLSVVLRDRRDVPVKDAAVDVVLAKLKDNLTQPLHRHDSFGFLRAVMDRQVETAGVYDTIDHVGTVMITNPDKDTRDLARGAFFRFLREYPQKKARWSKQLNFIVANLKYEREGGRLSIMEVIHLLLLKSMADNFVQEVAATCFLPLVFVLANDDSDKCRAAAAGLVKEIFRRADNERMATLLAPLQEWIGRGEGKSAAVARLGLLVGTFYFEARDGAARDKKTFEMLLGAARASVRPDRVANSDAELVNAALGAVRAMTETFPAKLLSPAWADLWADVNACARHEDATVKLAAVKLVGAYLADFAKNLTTQQTERGLLKGSHGIELDSHAMNGIARLGLGILNGAEVDGELARETAQILIFLGPRLRVGTTVDGDNADQPDEGCDEPGVHDEIGLREPGNTGGNDLRHLFWRLSAIIRKETAPRSTAIQGKISAMHVLETVARRIPAETLQSLLPVVLLPLCHATDPAIEQPFSMDEGFKKGMEEGVRQRARVAMDQVQKRVGTTEFSRELMAVRSTVRGRRVQRQSKRRIDAVADPERWGEEKRRKGERERQRKKERGREQKTRREMFRG